MVTTRARLQVVQKGFTIIEVLIALVILMVGIVAVAQLVPASILLNDANRKDTQELVFAQREIEQFIEQPLTALSFTDYIGNSCLLGDPSLPGQHVGSPIAVIGGIVVEDFSQAANANYSFTYLDPATQLTFETRWTVITAVRSNGKVAGKRFIVGVRIAGGNGFFRPVSLDAAVAR